MPADTYATVPSTGKLKLKGVSDSRIEKKKKKKKPKLESKLRSSTAAVEDIGHDEEQEKHTFTDNSVVLKSLEDEDAQIKEHKRKTGPNTDTDRDPKADADTTTNVEEMNQHLKTASELRFEEQRRKRLEERLKRDGVKTHKQKVEELNRYLSGLSEHHDMPKIGPG